MDHASELAIIEARIVQRTDLLEHVDLCNERAIVAQLAFVIGVLEVDHLGVINELATRHSCIVIVHKIKGRME